MCISNQKFTGMLKLLFLYIKIIFILVQNGNNIETSTQKSKIAELAYFTHFPSQILIS